MGPMATTSHALFPGSFDPVTLGHLDLIRRTCRLFDRVTIAVAAHHTKSTLLDAQQRVTLIQEVTRDLDGLEVTLLDGLLVDGARSHGATAIVRGVRGVTDLEYERGMAHTNHDMAPELETVFLLPAPQFAHVSSSLVRQIASLGGDVSAFVPEHVAAALARRFETRA
jgi:pantetheine-phosphate adenylyltransferase